ncbi:hypothetical protein HY990_05670 [Candidatus Micrarchaeota archaeon]|nr:hypothetical protein [Candidatus Micrarchaeota archaeon]
MTGHLLYRAVRVPKPFNTVDNPRWGVNETAPRKMNVLVDPLSLPLRERAALDGVFLEAKTKNLAPLDDLNLSGVPVLESAALDSLVARFGAHIGIYGSTSGREIVRCRLAFEAAQVPSTQMSYAGHAAAKAAIREANDRLYELFSGLGFQLRIFTDGSNPFRISVTGDSVQNAPSSLELWPRTTYLVQETGRTMNIGTIDSHLDALLDVILKQSSVFHLLGVDEPMPEQVSTGSVPNSASSTAGSNSGSAASPAIIPADRIAATRT